MLEPLTPLVLLAPGTLLLVALMSLGRSGPRPAGLGRALAAATALGLLVAVAAGLRVALAGPTTVSLLDAGGGLGFSLRLDALSALVFTMVALLSVVITRFSATYLDGDPREGRFLGRLAVTIASVQVLVLSGNLVLFALAWIATSLSLHGLLVFYPERPRARVAATKKFIVARVGDVCLVAAFVLLYRELGTGDLATLLERAQATVASDRIGVAAALVAVAALLKSAQFPTHGWLVEVMETPTPVSALLHAGILNAGPFLVMRFAGVMELGTSSAALLVVAGGFTALFASVVLLTQPSVKVALGYSSAAHMGFMLLVCGLGVYPAAVLHLVAHSFYKAHAFLSSGSVVETARASHVGISPRRGSPVRLLGSLGLALALYLGIAALLGFSPSENPALLAVGAILVMGLTQMLAPALDAQGGGAAILQTTLRAAAVTLAFFGLEEGTRLLLQDALPAITRPEPVVIGLAVLVLTAFAGAVAVQASAMARRGGFARALHVHLRNGLYANALFDRLVGALRS